MIDDLFRSPQTRRMIFKLGDNALVLQNFLTEKQTQAMIKDIINIINIVPFRYMFTPSGHQMSVAMTSCGDFGWITDNKGYRYTRVDPLTNTSWPKIPSSFYRLACQAAEHVGFINFNPNACLINEYTETSKMSLHQDKDEKNLNAPIVSFSLGLPALFLWGGLNKSDKVVKVRLQHGDVVVWGGVDRLRFHGIASIASGSHSELGRKRINLTFRQVQRSF